MSLKYFYTNINNNVLHSSEHMSIYLFMVIYVNEPFLFCVWEINYLSFLLALSPDENHFLPAATPQQQTGMMQPHFLTAWHETLKAAQKVAHHGEESRDHLQWTAMVGNMLRDPN